MQPARITQTSWGVGGLRNMGSVGGLNGAVSGDASGEMRNREI